MENEGASVDDADALVKTFFFFSILRMHCFTANYNHKKASDPPFC